MFPWSICLLGRCFGRERIAFLLEWLGCVGALVGREGRSILPRVGPQGWMRRVTVHVEVLHHQDMEMDCMVAVPATLVVAAVAPRIEPRIEPVVRLFSMQLP